MIEVRVVAVHDLGLAEVDGFAAGVDVGGGEIVKPELGFVAADVGDGGALAPLVGAAAAGVKHLVVTEMALLDGLSEGFEGPRRDGEVVHIAGDDLEDAGLEDDIGVGGVDFGGVAGDELEFFGQGGFAAFLAAPLIDRAAGEFHAAVGHQAEVFVKVVMAGEQLCTSKSWTARDSCAGPARRCCRRSGSHEPRRAGGRAGASPG